MPIRRQTATYLTISDKKKIKQLTFLKYFDALIYHQVEIDEIFLYKINLLCSYFHTYGPLSLDWHLFCLFYEYH